MKNVRERLEGENWLERGEAMLNRRVIEDASAQLVGDLAIAEALHRVADAIARTRWQSDS